MNVSSTPYIDIFIEQGTFRIEEYPSKPEGSSAISILNKIEEVLQGNLLLSTDDESSEGHDLTDFLRQKSIEIENNYNSKIHNLNCIQQLFYKELPKNKLYFDIVVEGEEIHIIERRFKPNNSGLALTTLESIEKAIEGIRQDKLNYSEGYSDEYADLSKEELLEVLMEKATLIADGYRKKRENLSFFGKFFSENVQNAIDKIESRLISPPVFPNLVADDKKTPLTDVIQEILRFLEVPDLGNFGQLNRQGNTQQQLAILDRAQEYGYEGNNKLQATNHLREIFNNIYEVHQYFYSLSHNSEKISKIKALKNIPNLDIYEFCNLCQTRAFYAKKFQTLRKIFKPKKNLTITPTIEHVEVKRRGLYDFLERAVACSVLTKQRGLPMELNLIEILLQNGAAPSTRSKLKTVFDYSSEQKELFELLLKYKINIPLPHGMKGYTLLTYYAMKGNLEYVDLLLKYGAPIDKKDSKAISPLGHAVAAGNTDVVRLLLEHGASSFEVLDAPFEEKSFLIEALIAGDIDIAELFFQAGVPIDLTLGDGTSLLGKLALAGKIESIEFLKEKRVDVNSTLLMLSLQNAVINLVDRFVNQKDKLVKLRDKLTK
ncbi:MAG: ankyrin repeat domain-containing protein [Parachlamydiaceae bacterium]|nr:ankyrin repeat domain-containing protein [Parachlamydiaceae bacterium]